nr:uncharacterized protein LOC102143493 [Macaca fascicularis]
MCAMRVQMTKFRARRVCPAPPRPLAGTLGSWAPRGRSSTVSPLLQPGSSVCRTKPGVQPRTRRGRPSPSPRAAGPAPRSLSSLAGPWKPGHAEARRVIGVQGSLPHQAHRPEPLCTSAFCLLLFSPEARVITVAREGASRASLQQVRSGAAGPRGFLRSCIYFTSM